MGSIEKLLRRINNAKSGGRERDTIISKENIIGLTQEEIVEIYFNEFIRDDPWGENPDMVGMEIRDALEYKYLGFTVEVAEGIINRFHPEMVAGMMNYVDKLSLAYANAGILYSEDGQLAPIGSMGVMLRNRALELGRDRIEKLRKKLL